MHDMEMEKSLSFLEKAEEYLIHHSLELVICVFKLIVMLILFPQFSRLYPYSVCSLRLLNCVNASFS